MPVNREGYLVHFRSDDPDARYRTYACANRVGLDALILHLTGRTADSYPQDSRGLPKIPPMLLGPGAGFRARLVIAHPLHIWTGEIE